MSKQEFHGLALVSKDELIYSSICRSRDEVKKQIWHFPKEDAQEFCWQEVRIEVLL